ncbi:MAG: RtcB family protein [Deltaproteobacteria bacterium]|nr:MAG: RtcB family protein [Deltaproteobacteria bacterium]
MKLERIDANRYRIPKTGRMRVPGVVYSSPELVDDLRDDPSLEQVANVAQLPGIVGASLAMPDIHWGYGFAIGGVAAFDPDEGVLSPGGVGYDINCGVRLLRTRLSRDEVVPRLETLVGALHRAIPSGVGSKSHRTLTTGELAQVLVRGARWAVDHGYGEPADLDVIEEGGTFAGADPDAVSDRAKQRGLPQLGSLGSGNHFGEVGVVAEIYDPAAAEAFGLHLGQVTVMLHSGSRGLGYQVCSDSLEEMLKASARYGIALPDRQLCAAPLSSPEARRYFGAMASAVNYAFANRQMLTHFTRQAFAEVFGRSAGELGMGLVYDVCHNIAKWETHRVDGRERRLCVHRKGATRAFGPGHADVPGRYRAVGQPVLIPGDMGRYSYVLAGTQRALDETFGSCCHGAGRRMSRHKALAVTRGRSIGKELAERGIQVRSDSRRTLGEEAPEAYKDVAEVVDAVAGAGIARKVAKLVPIAVVKG